MTVTVTLRYYLGQVKTGKTLLVHNYAYMIVIMYQLYTFHYRDKSVYIPPDTTLFGKSEWFKGQVTMYDGLTGKYGI